MKKIAYVAYSIMLSNVAVAADNECNEKTKLNCNHKYATELPTVTVTANRMETDIAKYAGQVTVLGDTGLQKSENVVRALGTVPGVQSGYDWGRSIGSNFAIRGFGYQAENRVIIQQDGVKRSPSLFSNHISSFRADTGLLKRVEVVKGASSILHGGGAIGGIISMETKNADDFIQDGKNIGFTVGGRLEANNLSSGHIAFAVKPENAPINLLVYGKKSKLGDISMAEGGTVNSKGETVDKAFNDEHINVGYIKVGVDISQDMKTSISLYNYEENLDTVWQNIYHNNDFRDDPVKGKLKQTDYVFDFNYKPQNNALLDLSFKAYKSNASYNRAWSNSPGGSYDNFYDNQDKRWGLSIKNTAIFDTGPIEHQLVGGLEYESRNEDAIMFSRGAIVDFGSMPNYYKDTGVYIQDNIKYGIVDLTIGARYDSFNRGVDKEGAKTYSASHLSPKIAIAVEALDGVNLLAGYSETFRAPTPHETSSAGALNPFYYYIPNKDLKPETAKEIEVGFSVEKSSVFATDDSLYFKATYFDGKINDMISIKRLPELGKPPESRFYAQYQNTENARRKGVEVEGKYEIGTWDFTVGYDHLDLTNEKTGKKLSLFSDKVSLGAGYTHKPWGLSVGLKATHWFKPDLDELTFTNWGRKYEYANRAFTIVDLKGKWSPDNTGYTFFDDGFKLNFGVNNVFDKKFMRGSATKTSTSVGKGRNAYIGFEKTF